RPLRALGISSSKLFSRTRIMNKASVDETLFGAPRPRGPIKYEKGETLQIVTSNLVRDLRIPRDPQDSVCLSAADFQRITSASQNKAKQEMKALKEAYQRKREQDYKNAEERKRKLFEIDQVRKENHALTRLELEARDRAQCLMERTNNLKMEQEEEIKNLNKIILNVKCQAIRDAQIQEKKHIQANLSKEKRRLDAMMEEDRLKVLESEAQIEELRRKQKFSAHQKIHQQAQKKRQEKKEWQDVTKELDRQHMEKVQEKLNQEELEALERRRKEKERLQMEVRQINAETQRAKEQQRAEEKLAESRIIEYNQKKMAREAKYEAEKNRVKREKELRINMVRAQQEKTKMQIAAQKESYDRRIQEIADREWRIQQRELARKKVQGEATLKAARLQQVRCKEEMLSVEADRQRAEFERILKVQEEAILKQKKREEEQLQRALRHAELLQQQMKERELAAVAKRMQYSEEADQLRQAEEERLQRINKVKEKKLKELQSTVFSEKHRQDAERKANDFLQNLPGQRQINLEF
uniref:Cilia- and flagella-associated protein 45 n=1 Tax=Echeneis naucrates TaxID=173247 RepID=A0A665VPZ8_ECHNA